MMQLVSMLCHDCSVITRMQPFASIDRYPKYLGCLTIRRLLHKLMTQGRYLDVRVTATSVQLRIESVL